MKMAIILRRSVWSAMGPLMNVSRIVGTALLKPTAPSMSGESVSCSVSQ